LNNETSDTKFIVLKFGSSVLRTSADLPNAVHEIYRWYRGGYKVAAVVSAIGLTTDELLCEARRLSPTPDPYAAAELLATGERVSAALLGIALDRSGIPARVLNPREIELIASGGALDSELVSVNAERVQQLLDEYPVLVVPGFFGTDGQGRTHVLGRGGSDLTAVFLAQALRARCRLIKDVDGVYECDPAFPDLRDEEGAQEVRPRRFVGLSYADALRVAGQLIQPKAVSFVQQHCTRAEVARCASSYETLVHACLSKLDHRRLPARQPSRVMLLGLGTVGFGVYQRLVANPEYFQVVGALIRDRGKYERLGLPTGLLRTRPDQVLKLRVDIVVDTLSDPDIARELAEAFLSRGVDFVSAGKRLIAEAGPSLLTLAERFGSTVLYRAAVGGATPMIEAVERSATCGPIAALTGVLNGTCNFVLDRCREGLALSDAVAEAQRAGFAEADPSADLRGEDSARKLSILCRHAFNSDPRILGLEKLDELIAERARECAPHGLRLRQIARASVCAGEVQATVGFETVPDGSPFGRLRNEWNGLQILCKNESLTFVTGRGAGRWATSEAILGDLFEIRRRRCGV
jgi:homoserine dehydrogenase